MSALQETGRVEQDGGLKFYEQDIVQLDYIYTEDVIVDFDVRYNKPGFGLIVSVYDPWNGTGASSKRMLLAKVGSMECSFYEKTATGQELLKKESCTLVPDGKEYKFRFRKTGTMLYIYESVADDDKLLARCSIGESYDRFTLGIYSGAGNTVLSMNIEDDYPNAWGTSIKNTNGGRLSFEANGFTAENAENAIEVIRENIPLETGRYFLSFKTSPLGDGAKADCYVFPSKEPRIKAKEKNLLKLDEEKYDSQPYFDITNPQDVTVLFELQDCEIKNVAIKEDAREDYVSTGKKISARDGSFLQIALDKINSVHWKGTVDGIPEVGLDETPPYGIFVYDKHGLTKDACHIQYGKEYDFDLENYGSVWILEVRDGDDSLYYGSFPKGEPTAKIFFNVSGSISEISVTDTEGKKKDVIHQRTIHKSVPKDVESPVIIVGEDGVPFDISAAYRVLKDGSYYFTDWEREVFQARHTLNLQKEALGDTDVILYGLREEGDMTRIYDVEDEEHVNSIDAVTKRYDLVSGDHYTMPDGQTIVVDDEVGRKGYTAFIVDYLKKDSYAINEKDAYEVMVSTKDENAATYFDMADSGEIQEYKILDLAPADDRYIVLRRAEKA